MFESLGINFDLVIVRFGYPTIEHCRIEHFKLLVVVKIYEYCTLKPFYVVFQSHTFGNS